MKIVGDGHLSTNGKALAKRLVEENRAGFDALSQSITEFRTFAASCEVEGQDSEEEKQKVIALILAARLLEVAEAAFIVMQHGMSTESNSLFRVFLDAYFVFGNVCSRQEFVAEYFKSDEADRLKLINASRKHSSGLFKPTNEGISEAHRLGLKDRVESEKIQAHNSYNYAVKIGCEEIYDSMYRIHSAETHTAPRALERYAVEDASGVVLSAKDAPSEDEIPQRLYDYSYFIIKALSGLMEVFGCLDKEEIDRLLEDLSNVKHNKANAADARTSRD